MLNVYKSCPKIISLEKWKILTPLPKLPKNVWDLGKLIAAKGFKKLPKVQKVATSSHTASEWENTKFSKTKREREKGKKAQKGDGKRKINREGEREIKKESNK